MKIIDSIRQKTSFFNSFWGYSILLFLITLLTYGYQLFSMGFYWDDWQAVFLSAFSDPGVLWDYFAYDRPFSAWTYAVTFPFLPMVPLVWQVFTLLLRWLTSICFYALFSRIWPEFKRQFAWVCALLLVFPGFTLEPVSVAFNQHFLTFFLFSLSLLLMAVSVQKRKLWLIIPAVILDLIQMFTMEYFAGLEIVRPFIIFFLLNRTDEKLSQKIKKVFINWLPYLLVFGIYILFRFVYYPAHAVNAENLPNIPFLLAEGFNLQNLVKLITLFLQDFTYLILHAWTYTLAPDSISLVAKSTIFSWILGFLLAAGFVFFTRNNAEKEIKSDKLTQGPILEILIFGLVILLGGGLPVWVTERQIIVGAWSDRFALAPMLGAVILVVITLDWAFRTSRISNLFLAVLLGLSISAQVRNVNKYRLDWDSQKDFYWQLTWRVPALEPGTAVFMDRLFSEKVADYQAGFAINSLYSPLNQSTDLPYWYFTPRDTGMYFASLSPGNGIEYKFRNMEFSGDTSNAIALTYQPGSGCLLVLDPIYRGYPHMSGLAASMIPLTNPQRIYASGGAVPQTSIFGKEPEQNWCYYFQKADLARQAAEWGSVLHYYQSAQDLGFSPRNSAEWMPYIKASLETGDFRQAGEATIKANEITGGSQSMLCAVWADSVNGEMSEDNRGYAAEIQELLLCSPDP